MAYQIIVTEAFEDSVTKTSEWLTHKWSIRSALKFEKKLRSAIQQIIINPKIGRVSARQKDIQSILITGHNRLYYQVYDKSLALLELVETKQNPKRNKFE